VGNREVLFIVVVIMVEQTMGRTSESTILSQGIPVAYDTIHILRENI